MSDFSIEALREYLRLYRDQEPPFAVLVIPQRVQQALDDMTPEERQKVLDDIDGFASSYGLRTPTIIEVRG